MEINQSFLEDLKNVTELTEWMPLKNCCEECTDNSDCKNDTEDNSKIARTITYLNYTGHFCLSTGFEKAIESNNIIFYIHMDVVIHKTNPTILLHEGKILLYREEAEKFDEEKLADIYFDCIQTLDICKLVKYINQITKEMYTIL